MGTKQLSSKNIKDIEIEVKTARLKNMARENTKSLAIILTMLLRGEKLNK